MARERLEQTVRVEADIRATGEHRLEVRGVGSEIYRDAKKGVRNLYWGGAGCVAYGFMAFLLPVIISLSYAAGSEVASESPGKEYSPVWGWIVGIGVGVASLAGWTYLLVRLTREHDAGRG